MIGPCRAARAIAYKYSDLAQPHGWQNLYQPIRVKPSDAHLTGPGTSA
jgi:hypothetical protein